MRDAVFLSSSCQPELLLTFMEILRPTVLSVYFRLCGITPSAGLVASCHACFSCAHPPATPQRHRRDKPRFPPEKCLVMHDNVFNRMPLPRKVQKGAGPVSGQLPRVPGSSVAEASGCETKAPRRRIPTVDELLPLMTASEYRCRHQERNTRTQQAGTTACHRIASLSHLHARPQAWNRMLTTA